MTIVNEFAKVLEWWINDSIRVMEKLQSGEIRSISDEFLNKYIEVLKSAKQQIDSVQAKIAEFIKKLEKKNIAREDLLLSYTNAMTIDYEGEGVFLPSFTDNILKELSKETTEILSPYRGLYLGWKLGEIYHKWTKKKKIPKGELVELLSETSRFVEYSRSDKYSIYLNKLGRDEKFDRHIKRVKQSLKKVVFERKWIWEKILPYPPITSTHFYLSGIRYYLYPALYGSKKLLKLHVDRERFHVNSTDSGLFKPSEHYGSVLQSNEIEEIKELLEVLPPGSLMLDVVKEDNGTLDWNIEATNTDRQNLIYFEIWSKKISEFAAEILSNTLNRIDIGRQKEAYEYFKLQIGKNPLRKFYFDTGIYQAVLLSKKFKNLFPKVFYLTTAKSKVYKDEFDVAWSILEAYLENGIEYHYLQLDGWKDDFTPLSILTLFPTEGLSKLTSYLSSEREKEAKKISHGTSFHAKYPYFYVHHLNKISEIVKDQKTFMVTLGIDTAINLTTGFPIPAASLWQLITSLSISLLERQLPHGLNKEALDILSISREKSTRIERRGYAFNLLTFTS